MTLRIYTLSVLLIFYISHQALATVQTFEFTFGPWDFNDNVTLMGTNGVLSFSLDNGNPSISNQTYDLASDLVSVSASTVGGTFEATWTPADLVGSVGSDFEFVTTNASGDATYNSVGTGAGFIYSNAAGTLQFGNPTGADLYFDDGALFSGEVAGIVNVTTSVPENSPVPEPSTCVVLAGLVACFGIAGWGRRRRMTA